MPDEIQGAGAGGGGIQPGWWSRLVHGIAANYHWTEAEIFAIPLVRLRAYWEELRIDSGQQPAREYPPLPEEVKLAKMMQRARRREQKKRLKQQTAEAATSRRGLSRR